MDSLYVYVYIVLYIKEFILVFAQENFGSI